MKKIPQIILLIYCIAAFAALVFFCRNEKITRTVESVSGVAYEQKVDSIAFGYQLEQKFMPQYERLDILRIYVDTSECSREAGALQISVMEEQSNNIFCSQIPISELPQYGWVDIPVHLQLSCDQAYCIVLESIDCTDFGPKISFYDAKLAATKEQQGYDLTYAGMEVTNSVLRITFIYAVPIAIYEYLIYYIFGLVIVALIFGDVRDAFFNLGQPLQELES